jgi:phosphoribosylformylglycinamidine cyclo-ligase
MEQSRYEKRGVSSDKNEVHKAIKKLDHGLFKHSFCKVLPDPFSANEENAIILHADTAGTKTILAYLYWKETGDLSVWKGIAQDALVMNLDDMACCGVTNTFVLSNTILRNKKLIPGEVIEAVIEGTIEFIEKMKQFGVNIQHAGGETADVGDVVRTLDVGFTAYTQTTKSIVFENQIQAGDLILGLASHGQTTYENEYNSGIGCNGLTNARHDVLSNVYAQLYPETFDDGIASSLVYSGQYRMTDKYDLDDRSFSIGKLLLSPTRTYIPFLKELFRSKIKGLHGVIHCTGGAHSKVLKFVSGVHIIKDNMPKPAPIFEIIKACSSNDDAEMYKVLNMGIRLEIYGDQYATDQAAYLADQFGIQNQIIGTVKSSNDNYSKVTMRVNGNEWNY